MASWPEAALCAHRLLRERRGFATVDSEPIFRYQQRSLKGRFIQTNMSHPGFSACNTGNSGIYGDDGRPQGATQPSRTTLVPTLSERENRLRHSRDGGGAAGLGGPLRASVYPLLSLLPLLLIKISG